MWFIVLFGIKLYHFHQMMLLCLHYLMTIWIDNTQFIMYNFGCIIIQCLIIIRLCQRLETNQNLSYKHRIILCIIKHSFALECRTVCSEFLVTYQSLHILFLSTMAISVTIGLLC